CLPGRFEIVSPVKGFSAVPELILDGAHTPRSVALTMEIFERLSGGENLTDAAAGAGKKPVLLFACAADKDIEDIAILFQNRCAAVFLTRPGEAKAADLGRLESAFRTARIGCTLNPDYTQAIGDALRAADQAALPLLVTGSFYLVAEVKKYLSCRDNLPRTE
ncbi:MAG: hypothetical protein J6Y13_08175, partial [Treponema sp.]|nr:hypothetical protein [Treponema sp.]